MIDLDARARAAADGLKASVGSADLRLASAPPGTVTSRPPWAMFAAGAGVAAAIVVATVVDVPELEEPVTATTVTTVTTTVPEATTTVPTAPTSTVPTTPATGAPVATAPSTTATTLDTTPPPITITDPADGTETEESRITFRGTTEPGASVFAGDFEATVAADGSWSIVLLLSPGETTARFVAVDAAGNEASASVTVTLIAPEPETTTTTKPKDDPETTTTTKPAEQEVAPFTAVASFGVCAEVPPWDIYSGTGEPGTVVQVTSPYGSGSTVVGSNGTWEVKVFFPDAPIGKSFEVTVKDELGRKKGFGFTHTEG
jgi:hypothetical protein